MSNAEFFLDVLNKLYPERMGGCVDARDENQLLIYEGDGSRSYIRPVSDLELKSLSGFLIKNANNLRIYLLALDACFFRSDELQRCDSLAFDDSCLCFVELKIDVGSRNSARQLRKARSQLGASIQFFKDHVLGKLPSLANYQLEAYVVMYDKVYPRARAARNSVFVQFLEEYGVELFEKNTKEF